MVVDESQDFAETRWLALLAALHDEETEGVYVFTDEGQQVFARYGRPPVLSCGRYSTTTCAIHARSATRLVR